MIRRPPRSTPLYSSAASDVYKRQSSQRPCSTRPATTARRRGRSVDDDPHGTPAVPCRDSATDAASPQAPQETPTCHEPSRDGHRTGATSASQLRTSSWSWLLGFAASCAVGVVVAGRVVHRRAARYEGGLLGVSY